MSYIGFLFYRNTIINLKLSTIRKVTGLVNPKSIDLVVTNNNKEMKNNYLLLQGNVNGKIATT